jgi:WD40 repeat-containing protein SMU1
MNLSTLEIESSDVIRLILQFLKENGLNTSFEALQRESQVTLNLVNNAEQLENSILNGRWEEVLVSISGLKLPLNKLFNLYEHIVIEMIEVKETDVARTMMRETAVLAKLKNVIPERFNRLESLINRYSTSLGHTKESDLEALYPQGNKQIRRIDIASELMREIAVVEPSRLLALLTKSIRFSSQFEGLGALSSSQSNSQILDNEISQSRANFGSNTNGPIIQSNQYDLFFGRFPTQDEEDESLPTALSTSIKFKSSSSFPESAKFSPDGTMLIVGARDGFIEVYNPYTGRLREELEYQAKEQFMALPSAIMCINFNKSGEYMIGGGKDGTVAVFKLKTGECVKEMKKIHQGPITSLSFSKDDSQILSSSLDGTIRISGIKSGKVLRNFFIDAQQFSTLLHQMISSSRMMTEESSSSSSSSAAAATFMNQSYIYDPSAFVYQSHFTRDNKFVVSASSDGFVRVWDNSGNGQCVRQFRPGQNPISSVSAESPSNLVVVESNNNDIHSLIPLPHSGLHQFVVSNKSLHIHLMNLHGTTLKTFSHPSAHLAANQKSSKSSQTTTLTSNGSPPPSPFITATISPKARFIFAVTEDHHLYAFNLLSGECALPPLSLHSSEVIAVHHHPFRNLLLSFATDGSLKVWKP